MRSPGRSFARKDPPPAAAERPVAPQPPAATRVQAASVRIDANQPMTGQLLKDLNLDVIKDVVK